MLVTEERLLDAAGRPRSPATMPGYHAGRPPRNKRIRYPADPPRVEEIVSVMRQAGPGIHGARLRGLIVVLWRAGLRISEAMGLAERDLDPDRGALLVRHGKGGKRREVGMDESGWEQLRPWLDHRARMPIGALFCVINGPTWGRPWSGPAARTQLRRLALDAGVRRRFAPHQLRHAHAVEMAREGVPLNVIQRQLGHAGLGVTSVYLQGIDNTEVISAVHSRRAPTMPASAGLLLSRRLLVLARSGSGVRKRRTISAVSRRIGVIGVPTSAGAFAPGQENAPRALREAGLVERLHDRGLEVRDHGDRERWRWRPDRANPRAQNLDKVVEIVGDTARRVAEAAGSGELTLVLGGDCTVGVGTVAGHSADRQRPGVIYFDAHADLNVPASVRPGTLDWMGMAHMLGEEGARAELVQAGPRVPLLEPDQVVLLGWDEVQSEAHERAAIKRLRLNVIPAGEVAADPAAAAARALALLDGPDRRLLVHFDVDVIDFTDTPLSENWGRNEGIPYDAAAGALRTLLASPRLAGVTITELNPDHVEAESGSVERLVRDVAEGLRPR